MSNRIGLAALSASAALALAGIVRASEPVTSEPAFSLTPSVPVYAADAAPRKPLMALLEKAGIAKTMDDYSINAGGFAEVSWTYNFDTPDSHTNVARVFDFEDQDPTFNQLDVFIEKTVAVSGSKFDWGGRMEWMWGGDARLIHSNGLFDHYGVPLFPGSPGTGDGPDEQFDLVQLYYQTNWPIGNGLLMTSGKFVTLLGYETINPTTNPLYSHSVIFGYAIPFTNTGTMAKYQFNDNWSATLALVRGWDQALEDNNASHAYMGQVAYTNGKLAAYFNFITGPEEFHNSRDWRTVFDGIVTYAVSDQLSLVWNGDYGWESGNGATPGGDDAEWCGMAVYASYKINDMFTLQARADYFSDSGFRGIGATTESLTFGVNIHPCPNNEWLNTLVFRPEIRFDHASDDIFNDGGDENQITFAVDAIYAF